MFKSETCVRRVLQWCVYVSTCLWNNSELSNRHQNTNAKMVPHPNHRGEYRLQGRPAHWSKSGSEVWKDQLHRQNHELARQERRCHSQIPQRRTWASNRGQSRTIWLERALIKLVLPFDSRREDLFETSQEKAGEKRTIFEKNEKSRKMETWKEQRRESKETRKSEGSSSQCAFIG